jgi:hypothetical protein
VNSRLKSRLERLESQIIPRQGERQVMEIQFISPDRVVARRLTVTLGPAMAQPIWQIRTPAASPETPTDND